MNSRRKAQQWIRTYGMYRSGRGRGMAGRRSSKAWTTSNVAFLRNLAHEMFGGSP